jgi:hypothetical protein
VEGSGGSYLLKQRVLALKQPNQSLPESSCKHSRKSSFSRPSGRRSVGGIAEDDGVDLIWIVIVFLAGS